VLAFFVPRPPGVETGPPLPGELLADLVVPLVHKDRVIGVLDLDVSGLPLGTFDGVSYDELKVDVSAGDAVVFYSDGVIEARKDREDYGAERLCRGLEQNASLSATEIGERLIADLEGFLGDEVPTTT